MANELWISNASPLIYTAKANLLDELFRDRIKTLNISDGVYAEAVQNPRITNPHTRLDKPDAPKIAKAKYRGWLKVHELSSCNKEKAQKLSEEFLLTHKINVEPVDFECMLLQNVVGGKIIYANTAAEKVAGMRGVPYTPLYGYIQSLDDVDNDKLLSFAVKLYDAGYKIKEMKALIVKLGGKL